MLAVHEEVRAVILPTLGPDRRATYSPFLPIHPRTGIVMQVPMEEVRPEAGTVVWRDPETGERFETPVTGGHVKAQWKADWALRWYALGVDYEMSGKDLIDSVRLSSAICRVLGAEPPVGFTYELFLDAEGHKISKTKGNGLTIEEWLRYGPPESLSLFMYQQPGRAKRLHFDVIPRARRTSTWPRWRSCGRPPDPANPAWHIHGGALPNGAGSPITFTLLLNLAVAANAETPEMLWGYLRRHAPGGDAGGLADAGAAGGAGLGLLPGRGEADEALPGGDARRSGRRCSPGGPAAREPGADRGAAGGGAAGAIQDLVYDAGRREPFLQPGKDPARPGVSRAWFAAIYQVLLGQEEGPRFGGFVALYGIPETVALIEGALGPRRRRPRAPAPHELGADPQARADRLWADPAGRGALRRAAGVPQPVGGGCGAGAGGDLAAPALDRRRLDGARLRGADDLRPARLGLCGQADLLPADLARLLLRLHAGAQPRLRGGFRARRCATASTRPGG